MISGDVDSRDMGPSLDAFIELEVIDLPITIYELDDFEAALLAFLFSRFLAL